MIFSETKVTEIYRMADDFCKEIAQFRGKYMVEDKDIEYLWKNLTNEGK